MYRYVKLLFLFFVTMFSVNVHAADVVNFSTINLLKESFRISQDDTIISGLSIDYAVDMLANGASGKSLEQLVNFLGTSIENKNNELHEQITNLPKTLEISNSIWGNEFRESYKNLLINILNVSVEQLPENTSVINDWIADKTHNRITSVLKPEQTDETDLYLVNTIYFKDNWAKQFNKKYTREEIFHSLLGTDVKVPMMHRTDTMLYAENSKVQSIKLPYENGGFLIVYLPREDVNFYDFISDLTPDDLDLDYRNNLVELSLPRFKVEKKTDVKEIFLALGIDEIFNSGYDFNNMCPLNPHVAKFIHQACVEVDEEGTVAAAATVAKMMMGAARPTKPIQFVVNRPFLFFVTQGNFIGFYTGNGK